MTGEGSTEGWAESVFLPDVILRLQYACYLFVGLLATMLFRGALGTLFDKIPILQTGCRVSGSNELRPSCTGEMVTYRISFALTIFFLVHWLSVSDVTCCIKSTVRVTMQKSFFYVKSVILGLLIVTTFFMPNSFFAVYAYAALFFSALFLMLNVLFLVDFSYQWSDDWGERAENNIKWMWYLLGIALGCFGIGIVVNGVSYYMFVAHPDCNFNAFAITSILVGGLLYTLLSIWAPHGSIVPSSIVFMYTSCIMFSTLRTQQNSSCHRSSSLLGVTAPSGDRFVVQPGSLKEIILNSIVASFTLAYAVVSSGGNSAALNIGVNDDGEDEDPDSVGHLSHYMFFYFIMMMGSMYLAMLSTGWHVSGAGDETLLGSVNVAFWVRSATVWLTMVLYIWSVLAPYTCCKDRDFGFNVDDDFD